MPSSVEHNTARLGELADDVRRGKDTSADKQASQIVRWAKDLTRWESQDVAEACRRWRDEHEFWPDGWLQFRHAVDDAAAGRRQAPLPAGRENRHADPGDIAKAVNAAFGLLSNGHLRELDRIEPSHRRRIAQDTGRFFLPHMEALARAHNHAERRPLIGMVSQFVEQRLGKTWRQILDEELADRPAAPEPVRGFKQVAAIDLPERVPMPEPMPVAAE